jgi:ethanolamine ammonia-lyase small subunit
VSEGRTWSERRVPAHLAHLVARAEPPPPPAAPTVRPVTLEPDAIPAPNDARALARIAGSTPSRIALGRAGTRYRTSTYLGLREDHAIAKDAVYAELPTGLAQELGCLEVASASSDREHYLLHPNQGRRLCDESRARLAREGTVGADVQLIFADGLASPALVLNGKPLLVALTAALRARGLTVAKPILARMARVGLQDDVGVLLKSRATAICLGERPGLGTGDSLSIYLAIGPKLDQDNAEKNCISNVRPQGISPERAAELAADLLARGLALGRGGLALA